jgi:hypothetical protein
MNKYAECAQISLRALNLARVQFFELPGPNDLGPGLEVFRAPLPTAYFVRGNCG